MMPMWSIPKSWEWWLLKAGVDGDLGDEGALADDVRAKVARVEQFFLQEAHRVDI